MRVRIQGDRANLNVKRAVVAIVRDEFEYPIPIEDAQALLDGLCMGNIIEKTRHKIPYAGLIWEVDEFHGANSGLVVAEIELEDEHQAFDKPPWIGDEVSDDPRYLNTSLAQHPYSAW